MLLFFIDLMSLCETFVTIVDNYTANDNKLYLTVFISFR